MIALVPHIIRAQPVDDQLAKAFWRERRRLVRVEHQQPPCGSAGAAPVTPTRPGTPASPQLPPPGGDAMLVPPTNNPKMPMWAQPICRQWQGR